MGHMTGRCDCFYDRHCDLHRVSHCSVRERHDAIVVFIYDMSLRLYDGHCNDNCNDNCNDRHCNHHRNNHRRTGHRNQITQRPLQS